jgi:hypothetical protein
MMVDAKSKRSRMDEKSRKKHTHTQRIDGTRMRRRDVTAHVPV